MTSIQEKHLEDSRPVALDLEELEAVSGGYQAAGYQAAGYQAAGYQAAGYQAAG